MRIFMIANNLKKDDKWIDKINSKYQLNDNDLVVRMNTCDLGKLFNYRADLIFFRTRENNDKTVGFWGGIKKNNKWQINISHFNKFHNIKGIYIRELNDKQIYNDLVKDYPNVKFMSCNEFLNKYCDKLETNPSMGYIVFCYLRNIYINATFILLGFTYYEPEFKRHDRGFEMSIYKKFNTIFEP